MGSTWGRTCAGADWPKRRERGANHTKSRSWQLFRVIVAHGGHAGVGDASAAHSTAFCVAESVCHWVIGGDR